MNPFTVIECEQRSPEWYAARVGKLTGSRAKDMRTKIKTGESAARRNLRTLMACERLTQRCLDDGYVSKEMQRGIDLEPAGIGEYEILTGEAVHRTGFLAHNELMAGCSLDGHVRNMAGIVEFKCPNSATHFQYLRGGIVPSEYIDQCVHNLWISGAQWCDFCSYDDRFPADLQLFVVRMERDDARIAEYTASALQFLSEVDRDVKSISALRKAA